VSLHFAEVWFGAPGLGKFDIVIEGRTVREDYEPIAAGFATARQEEFDVTLEDGLLEIEFVPTLEPPGIGPFLRGDCNGDGAVAGQVTDAVFLLSYSFTGGAAPPCLAACDGNADGKTDISDAISILNFNFLGGPPPAAPFPSCDRSALETDAGLGCSVPVSCP